MQPTPAHACSPSGSPDPGEAASAAEGRALPPAPSSSLDTTETSVRDQVEAFLSEKPAALNTLKIGLWDSWAVKWRHSGWKHIREKIHASLIRTDQTESRINAFCTCGTACTIERTNEGITPQQFRIRGSSCHDRLCTPCANTRSYRLQLALQSIMEGKRLSFITLTLAGKDAGLSEKIDRLYKGFRALRLHPTFANAVRGGAAFLEVKWSDKAKRWHPHLHLICDADFIDQGDLSAVWRGITKDSYIVDVRRVKQLEEAARYVTKYASKPLNTSFSNTPALLDEALIALKGRRLCFAFGDWYGTPLDFDTDELLDEDEVPSEGWHSFMPLEVAIQHANHGDAYCRELIIKAGGEVKWRQALLGFC